MFQIRLWAIALLAMMGAVGTAYAVPVAVEVNWPNWSSENRVVIKDSGGATLQTICNPATCFDGTSNNSYSNTFNYNLAEGLNYTIEMEDSYGDAWNGTASYVRVYSDGKLVFQDSGPPTTFQSASFDVAALASTGSQTCTAFTGAWSGNSATTSSGVGVSVSRTVQSGGGWDAYASDNLNTINTFSEASVQGHTSLETVFRWDTTPDATTSNDAHDDGVTGTYTVNFDQSVVNPVFHFDRIGGSAGTTSNGVRISLTSSGTIMKLAGPSHFEVFDKFVQRTIYETLSGTSSTESNLTSTEGTAAGSFYVSGTHTAVAFEFEGRGPEGTGGDAFEMVVCADPIVTNADYSDAPASYGNAMHTVTGGIQLGGSIDADSSTLASAGADGDDTDGTDDEDGVSSFPALTVGDTSYVIPIANISATGTGTLHGWIDFDSDGAFETSEYSSVTVTSGALSGNMTWASLPTMSADNSFARFRFTTDSGVNNSTPSGSASDGEVEDYILTINASGGGSPICGFESDKFTNWASGNFNYNELDLDGSGLNMSVAVTGETGRIAQIEGGAFNGVSGLDLRTNGFFGAGVTFTYNFSVGVSSVGFDIGHINTGAGGGDYFVITARDTLGNTVFPTFTTSGSSYTADSSTGIVDATGSTAENLGVHFEDPDLITQVIIVWDDCTTCGTSFHGMAIGEMQPCLPPTTLAGSKSVTVWDPNNDGLYAIPGNDVIYSITASNTGLGATDTDSLVLIDVMPSDVEFYNGDIDDVGPETNPVSFTQSAGAGLTFTYTSDVGYSDSATKPTNFAGCTFSPAAGYDSRITYICFNPKGALAAGDPDPNFTLNFRARIK